MADVCHIAGDKPGAKRYDPTQTADQRQGFGNLIVLCATHHRIIDDDELTYTRPILRKMKRDHESKATQEYLISDEQLDKILILLGGTVVAVATHQITRDVLSAVHGLMDFANGPATETVREDDGVPHKLIEMLRFAPRGTIQLIGTDARHRLLGRFFTKVFRAAGWRVLELSEPVSAVEPVLFMKFTLADRDQISNVSQAIWDVFSACGFQEVDKDTARQYSSGDILKIAIGLSRR